MPAIVTPPHDNKRSTIAFARRVADHITLGASSPTALRTVAQQLNETHAQADAEIAEAATKIADRLLEGHTKYAWAPNADILGNHLVSLVATAYEDGGHNLGQALHAAADTLESDLRTGYAS